jgi:hypothetical protein
VGFTGTFPLLPLGDKDANVEKRVFFKPLVVFTNERCYSACDALTGLIQEHRIAPIIGEQKFTGGGGANVWNLNMVVASYGPVEQFGLFAQPYRQDIRFPFRQLQYSKQNPTPVEDLGIYVDRVLRPTHIDIVDKSSAQLNVLMGMLDRMYTGRYPQVTPEIPTLDYIKVSAPMNIDLQQAKVLDFGFAKNVFDINSSRAITRYIDGASFADGISTKIILPLFLQNPALTKLTLTANVKTEVCCDRLHIITETQDGTQSLVRSLGGLIENERVEIPLQSLVGQNAKVYFWMSSDLGANLGHASISDLKVE